MPSKIDLPKEEIIEKYRKNVPLATIAFEYGVSSPTIKKRLYDWGILKLDMYSIQRLWSDSDLMTVKRKLGCSMPVLTSFLENNGYADNKEVRHYARYSGMIIMLNKEDLIKDYKSNMTISELSRKYRVSRATIRNRLNEWGVTDGGN